MASVGFAVANAGHGLSPNARDWSKGAERLPLRLQSLILHKLSDTLRLVRRSQDNSLFWGFNPAVSASALKSMRATIRELDLRHRNAVVSG
jgi:hypothetical protein